MIRSALILCAGILAMVCVPASPLVRSAAAQPACTASSFVAAVRVLDWGYTPNRNGANYSPPSLHSSPFQPNVNTNITSDLTNAFNNAPPFFQRHLCELNAIYINPYACANRDAYHCGLSGAATVFTGAWGFRSQAQTDLGFTYAAIPAGLWPNGGPAWPFHYYETQVLSNFPGSSGSSIDSASPDDSWMTILAALAHELGHVRWVTTTLPSVGGTYYFGQLQNCRIDAMTTDFFYLWSYNNPNQLVAANRWRDFNSRDNAGHLPVDHSVAPTLYQLGSANPAMYLYQLYQANLGWASLFGARTPDEDLVESYVMYVLTGYTPDFYNPANDRFAGPLTSLPLTIPGYAGPGYSTQWADVPRDLRAFIKPKLQAKMKCIPV